jgi:hypothetical protein
MLVLSVKITNNPFLPTNIYYFSILNRFLVFTLSEHKPGSDGLFNFPNLKKPVSNMRHQLEGISLEHD